MKIENRRQKNQTFPFLQIPFTTPSLMIQWKLGCRSRKQKRKNQPIAKPGIDHCHWFILPFLLATPTMQSSLDHKWRSHKQNQSSASDSVSLIFTKSYRSTLLNKTRTSENQPLNSLNYSDSKMSPLLMLCRNVAVVDIWTGSSPFCMLDF